MIELPKSNDYNKFIVAHSMIENSYYSFITKYKRLYEYEDRRFGIKFYSKYKKREGKQSKNKDIIMFK